MKTARLSAVAVLVWGIGAMDASRAQTPAPSPHPKIFTCVDKNGRRLSADRPIPECQSQEQKLLNRDGSVRAISRPLASPEEVARLEEQHQATLQSQAQQEETARKERQLIRRYPDEQAHALARARALAPVLRQIDESQQRQQSLERERETLVRQAKIEKNPSEASALRQRLDTHQAAIDAQLVVRRDREAEQQRLNQQFDQELLQLKALWAAPASAAGRKP